MLNKCTDEGWFVVELCESIRAHKVELANFELFSSTPKDVRVSLAGTYPAKEWELFGVFEAEDSRDVQARLYFCVTLFGPVLTYLEIYFLSTL